MRILRTRLSAALGLAASLAASLATGGASAQPLPSLDARTFRPSTDPRAQLVLEPIAAPAAWSWNVGAWLNYANRPVSVTDATSGIVYRPVEHHLGLDLTAGLGLGARAAIGVVLPMALYQTGTQPLPPGIATRGATPNTAIGDVALHLKGALVDNAQGGLGVAALGVVTLPTGDRASFLGEGSVTASARLLVDYDLLVAGVQASVGYKLRTAERTWPDASLGGTTFGGEIPWSFGIRLRPGVLKKIVNVDSGNRQTWEIAARGTLPGGPVGPFGTGEPGSARLSPVLLALSDRIELGHFRDTFVLAGVDIGLGSAAFIPTVRGVLALGWAPREHDADHDGVPDDVDQCAEIPEDRDGFEDSDGCPDIDDDEDGITDDEDACPRVPGEPSDDPKKNGCPAAGEKKPEPAPNPGAGGAPAPASDRDDDGDGVADAVDACPKAAGEPSTDPAQHGCPSADRDGDTYANADDKCPDAAEVFNGVADDDGCPDEGGKALVGIDTKSARLPVTLAAPIRFSGTADGPTIAPQSLVTVRALALELHRHPDWTLAVGARPEAGKPEITGPRALARAFAIVRELAGFTRRDGIAETVGWDAVRAQPGSASGLGFLILVAPR